MSPDNLPLDPPTAIAAQRNPVASLRVLRILWAALLAGEVCFLFMIINTMPDVIRASQISPRTRQFLELFAACFMALAMLAAFIARKVIFSRAVKAHGGLTAPAYFTGTVLFLAICEGATFFGLMCIMMTHAWWPTVLIPAAGMALQVISFPAGGPLRAGPASAGDN